MLILSAEEQTVSIASDIRNAFIDFSKMTVSVVKITTDVTLNGEQVAGYGFNSNGRYAQAGLLNERFIPRLLDATPDVLLDADGKLSPHCAWDIMMRSEKPGGHGERSVAVGVLDMALWDIAAKLEQKPLCRLLAERYGDGELQKDVFVYAAGGYYHPGKDLDVLKDEIQGYLERGFETVKMKIGGASLAEDVERIEAVLELVAPEQLAVDANGRFDLKTALAYGEVLERYGLRWLEEAGDPLDYALQAALGESYHPPLATGENLFSHQDVRNLLRYGGLRPDRDILQMDPVLSYGLVEYLRMLDALKTHGWSPERCIPHGGHQFALHIAAGLGLGGNEAYPEVFAPFGSFPASTPVKDGRVTLPDAPGIGFEVNEALWALLDSSFD